MHLKLSIIPPQPRPFVERGLNLEAYPHTRSVMEVTARQLARMSPAALLSQTFDPESAEGHVAEHLLYGIDELPDGISTDALHQLVETRAQLLRILIDKGNHKQAERQKRGIVFVGEQADILLGFSILCESNLYQFGQSEVWWRDDDEFSRNEKFVEEHRHNPERLERSMFDLISAERYRAVTRNLLLKSLLTHHIEIGAIIHFYTADYHSEAERMEELNEIMDAIMATLPRTRRGSYTALPMLPLYSLPRESQNIYRLVVAKPADLDLGSSGTLRVANSPARAKLEGDDQLLLFDTSMVLKRSGAPDSYISIELERPEESVMHALTTAIEQLGIEAHMLEHIPRIVAGIFTAARLDQDKDFTHEGAFWDTESGRRLCKLIGFDPDNHKHRARVQHAREVLSRVILHREVVTSTKQRRTRVDWSGPIIQRLQDKIELKVEQREGIADQQTLQSWLVAKELWNMTRPKKMGGMPAFMLIDQRAFLMDASDSTPFNLYWTLINRAYVEQSIQPDGSFAVRLSTLYEWAGLEHQAPRNTPGRLSKQIVKALEKMREVGLLTQWRCEALTGSKQSSFAKLEEATLEVQFDEAQLQTFPTNLLNGGFIPEASQEE